MKIKYFFLLVIVTALIFSCSKDDTSDPFDHAAQAIKDDATIREYLETHFYTRPETTEHFGSVAIIESGETPIMSEVETKEVTRNDIKYKIYFLKNELEGVGISPIEVDSTLMNYRGLLLDTDKTVFDENIATSFWANLYGGVVPGWTYALPNFKSGVNVSQVGMPLKFEQTGKGIIFIPSGLAFRDLGDGSIPANSPLMFHVEMAMVKRNDQDRDGIKSIYEDSNNDLDVTNDDSDSDGNANFIDFDDDNDGLATRYENADANTDGNPDDATDTDSDSIPDYLDSDDDGDGILTKNENADPNGDGNPSDAKDTDGDTIPDYLDAN